MTYKVYDSGFRGKCPSESIEQVTFFNKIRREYLEVATELGAFACVAYGWKQAWQAFMDWKG